VGEASQHERKTVQFDGADQVTEIDGNARTVRERTRSSDEMSMDQQPTVSSVTSMKSEVWEDETAIPCKYNFKTGTFVEVGASKEPSKSGDETKSQVLAAKLQATLDAKGTNEQELKVTDFEPSSPIGAHRKTLKPMAGPVEHEFKDMSNIGDVELRELKMRARSELARSQASGELFQKLQDLFSADPTTSGSAAAPRQPPKQPKDVELQALDASSASTSTPAASADAEVAPPPEEDDFHSPLGSRASSTAASPVRTTAAGPEPGVSKQVQMPYGLPPLGRFPHESIHPAGTSVVSDGDGAEELNVEQELEALRKTVKMITEQLGPLMPDSDEDEPVGNSGKAVFPPINGKSASTEQALRKVDSNPDLEHEQDKFEAWLEGVAVVATELLDARDIESPMCRERANTAARANTREDSSAESPLGTT